MSPRAPSMPSARAGAGDAQQLALGQPHRRQALAGRGDALAQGGLARPPTAPRTPPGRPRRPAAGARSRPARRGRAARAPRRPSPKRSSSCGRSSPSSTFIVPTSRKRDACTTDTASRSTRDDARRRRVEQRVDQVVGQQVDLVDVEDPLVRAGEQPGLEGALAGQRAAEVERPDEAVQRRAQRQLDQRAPRAAPARRRRHDPFGPSSPGANANGSPAAAVTGGSSGASARTAVDFAVPRSPRTSTPPTSGATALTSSASISASWPTIARERDRPGSRARLLQLALESEVAVADARRASRRPAPPTCPRSAASSSRSAIARAAHGFERDMNSATSGVEQVALRPPARTSSPRRRPAVAS